MSLQSIGCRPPTWARFYEIYVLSREIKVLCPGSGHSPPSSNIFTGLPIFLSTREVSNVEKLAMAASTQAASRWYLRRYWKRKSLSGNIKRDYKVFGA
jgi:hypothetical protein